MPGTARDAIVTAVRRVLSVRGPMVEDDPFGVLTADGMGLGPDPEEMLADVLDEDAELVLPLMDGRWVWLPALLAGRIFTHRLSTVEAEHDLIEYGPDVAPLMMLTENQNYRRLTDGSPVADVSPFLDSEVLAARGVPGSAIGADGAVLFEAGRFAALGVAAGDLVGLRVTGDGFELAAAKELMACDLVPALSALLDDRRDEPEMLDVAVWTACAGDERLFRETTAPLGELLSAGGLAQQGDWVAPGGFDFGGWRVQDRIKAIGTRYDLHDDEALAVLATVRLYEQTAELIDAVERAQEDGDAQKLTDVVSQLLPQADSAPSLEDQDREPDRRTVRASLEFLAEPAVAAAVLAETSADVDRAGPALGLFAESVEPLAPRAARPALRWLRAKAYERLGDIEQAEQTYRGAESLDPS